MWARAACAALISIYTAVLPIPFRPGMPEVKAELRAPFLAESVVLKAPSPIHDVPTADQFGICFGLSPAREQGGVFISRKNSEAALRDYCAYIVFWRFASTRSPTSSSIRGRRANSEKRILQKEFFKKNSEKKYVAKKMR
jgi:hypothetical protein